MEAHPEKYPGGTYVEPQEGKTTLIFLKRKPTSPDSSQKPKRDSPTDELNAKPSGKPSDR
jgi:hypothetical protein